jgi:hypothetical protein
VVSSVRFLLFAKEVTHLLDHTHSKKFSHTNTLSFYVSKGVTIAIASTNQVVSM